MIDYSIKITESGKKLFLFYSIKIWINKYIPGELKL